MLKKTISFTDYNGNQRSKDYWFNMNRAELAEMELREKQGMEAMLTQMVEEDDRDKMVTFFKNLIQMSIGEKSEDGMYFFKSEECTRKFVSSEAYTELWMELISDAGAAVAFVNGIIPQGMAEAIAAQNAAPEVQPAN